MTIKSLNRSLAKQDPEGTFGNPFGVVEERLFTRGEKIATLDRWRSAVVSALGEERRARLLIEIVEARNRLTNPESRLASD